MPISIPIILQKKRSLASALKGLWHGFQIIVFRRKFHEFFIKPLHLHYRVPSDTIFGWYLSKYGAYEAENTNLLHHWFHAGQGGLYVDVGANFGWYSMQMARFAGDSGKVISIEPEANNQALLMHNIKLNAANNVTLIKKGIAEKEMTLNLYHAPEGNPGMHSFVEHEYMVGRPTTPSIAITTLDHIMGSVDGTVELLKMDIEGYEINALMGAQHTLRRCKRILVEYSPMFIKASGQDYRQFFDLIDDAGFDLYELNNNQLVVVHAERLAQIKQASEGNSYFQQDFIGIQRNLPASIS